MDHYMKAARPGLWFHFRPQELNQGVFGHRPPIMAKENLEQL
jgi:hypothetical protein